MRYLHRTTHFAISSVSVRYCWPSIVTLVGVL
jgi:hypothetical protein